ncbi:LexA family transcriptional regulator [Yersinia intermedia]|uniref:LexA family transcriptional regulator n=1 Tax=Yersinia intermedia TaxID=631 RepID=UPI0005DDF246|nr:helix-turn-helix transcriptional regulator [Yersinia intermedia]WET16965.1 helix-turn-helix transcriptional regulator [Yersinia intermedia]CNH56682.1 Uncharacterized HTH-type transcriptional regulator HI_1476 [Yersinia intermedia]
MEKSKNMASATRISQLLAEKGWNQSDLARRLSVTPQSVQFWVSGKTSPRGKSLAALSAVSGYPEHWFLMKDPSGIESGSTAINPIKGPLSNNSQTYRVEFLDIEASAGPGIITKGEFVETIRSIEYTNEEARNLFGGRPSSIIKMITVNGDSMQGTIEVGDQIFIDTHVNYFDGDGIYVFVYGQTLHVKRLQMLKDQLLVISDNAKYREWFITENDQDQFFVTGKVLLSQSRAYKRHG